MKSTESCVEYQSLLSAEMDGELDERELVALRQHLAECADCSRWQAAAGRLNARVAALLDDQFAEQVGELCLNSRRREDLAVPKAALVAFPTNATRNARWFWAAAAMLFLGAGISLAIYANRKPPVSTVSVQPLVDLHAINVQSERDQQAVLETVELELRAMKLQMRRMDLDPAERDQLENRIESLFAKTRSLHASTPISYQGEK
jgi:anti-sigma factor RsiW